MMCKEVYFKVDGEYKAVGHIEDRELSTEDADIKDRFLSTEPIELDCQIENPTDIEKIICGFDKGLYNGRVLRRDGYLSPQNGWLNGGT